jgi:hypothetical protein
MVREATPLTRIVPVETAAPKARRGRLVLEVQDPEASAPPGEQLSLVTPDAVPAAKSTRSRKRTTTPATVSKAKQTSPIDEVSLTVPQRSTAAQATDPMLERVQQLSQTIEQLQSQLEQLHRPSVSANDNAPSPTIKAAKPRGKAAPHPHLPDWSEPELRSHYTLEESARAYAALEVLHSHRKLHPPAAPEIDQAHAVAQRLRQYQAPVNLPPARPDDQRSAWGQRRAQRRPVASGLAAAPVHRVKRRSRWQWNRQAFWRNLQQLSQSIVPVPVQPGAKVVDVVAWVAGSIALRWVIKGLIYLIPALALPLNLLMAIPAIVAAYLAFCVPNSRSDVIYRLLLVTLGLFLGSRI